MTTMTFDEEKKQALEYLMKDSKVKDYKMTITVPAAKMMELAYDIMCNYPEASFCLKCTSWKYSKGIFKFYDEEEDKEYTVTTQQIAEKGLPLFINGLLNKTWYFDGMAAGDLLDAGSYDSGATDGVVQCVIFGDVIYG
jgi:hypothetical protein